ncbi:hypothetical protein BRD00_12175 [Halobacteriales archaeon QS_8_69_26]|nr:MAG: hypothetical protein BRD00_12175 [Halobacteriales archaeon QS_8_69_26]
MVGDTAADLDDGSGDGSDDPGSRGDGTVPESNVTFDEDELADPVADPDVDVADVGDGAPVGPRPADPEDPEKGPPVGPRPADPEDPEGGPPVGPRPAEPDEEEPGPPGPEEGPQPAEPDDGPPGPGPDDASPEDPDEPDEATFGPPPDGPPDDEEMPLADHIEEMVSRLGVVAVAVAAATALAFPLAEDVLVVMWYDTLPAAASDPHVYGPLEKILAEIKVASLAGILVALPVLVYQSYLFMRPGLYPRERKYYLAAVPTSLVLGTIGMAFAYFLVLPALFQYFVYYSESGVDRLAFGLRVTFDLIVAMLGAFAVVFQIPLLIMLAIMMGVTSRQWLENRRIYFWGGFVGVGFLMGGADLTGMAPIIIGATMIGLFEGTLLLLRWTDS